MYVPSFRGVLVRVVSKLSWVGQCVKSLTLSAVETRPPRGALALSIIGTAARGVVAGAGVDAVGPPGSGWTGCSTDIQTEFHRRFLGNNIQ